ncbi:ComEA family DNA-binding protein [Nevskia sp.]|uniref:ComEA family DNA-binding protein n=1 Tax=Nevskia sp. TaxID=1929292 RepID=UPI0025FFA749|nr:ComEA family DNA-binding protein [Nevskia sp.]
MNMLKALLAGFALTFASATWAASVDINTADAKALESLDGVGPSKAQAIVKFRAKNGAFKSVDDLEKVPGIGAATIAKNRDNLTVSGGKASKADKAAAKKDGKKDAAKD